MPSDRSCGSLPTSNMAATCGLAGRRRGKSVGSAALAGLRYRGRNYVDLLVVLAVLTVIAWLRSSYK